MKLDSFLISLFVILFFLLSGTLITQNQMDNYDKEIQNEAFSDLQNITKDAYSNSSQLKNTLNENPVSQDTSEDNLFAGGYRTVRKIWNFFSIPGKLLASVQQSIIPLPALVSQTIIIIISISVLFSTIYLIFRFQPR